MLANGIVAAVGLAVFCAFSVPVSAEFQLTNSDVGDLAEFVKQKVDGTRSLGSIIEAMDDEGEPVPGCVTRLIEFLEEEMSTQLAAVSNRDQLLTYIFCEVILKLVENISKNFNDIPDVKEALDKYHAAVVKKITMLDGKLSASLPDISEFQFIGDLVLTSTETSTLLEFALKVKNVAHLGEAFVRRAKKAGNYTADRVFDLIISFLTVQSYTFEHVKSFIASAFVVLLKGAVSSALREPEKLSSDARKDFTEKAKALNDLSLKLDRLYNRDKPIQLYLLTTATIGLRRNGIPPSMFVTLDDHHKSEEKTAPDERKIE